MVVAVSGGGTGGHLSIAKSFCVELKSRGIKTIFIGSNYGQDRAWFEKSGLFDEKYFLPSSGVVNKSGLGKVKSLANILKLALNSKKILKKHNAKAIISVGGYSAAPASIGAITAGLPLFLHEQNAFTGNLNRVLKPFARGFYSSYFEPKFDYPIRDEFFKTARIRENLGRIIFLGGSQGASFINNLAMNLSKNLLNLGYELTHQCGEREFAAVSEFYRKNALNVRVVGFCDRLEELMAEADLCVGRSGASSLWELCANNLPSIFVPFPYAANNHQFYNAKFLLDDGLCEIVEQKDANEERILAMIRSYDVAKVSGNLAKIISPKGTKTIIDDILSKI